MIFLPRVLSVTLNELSSSQCGERKHTDCYGLCLDVPPKLHVGIGGLFQTCLDLECVIGSWCPARVKGALIGLVPTLKLAA